jgi:hypothetical protein
MESPYTKYYVIQIIPFNDIMYDDVYVSSRICDDFWFNRTIYRAGHSYTQLLSKKYSNRLMIIASLDENSKSIPCIKKDVVNYHNAFHNVYWIENDSDKPFNLLDHL